MLYVRALYDSGVKIFCLSCSNQDVKVGYIRWLAQTFDMNFINVTEDLSRSVKYHHKTYFMTFQKMCVILIWLP